MDYEIENFYDVNMVKISTTFKKGEFKTTKESVFSKDFKSYNKTSKKGMISPTQNCHFIIGGYSISKDSIFEINNVYKLGYHHLEYGGINYTTYCLPKNCEKVKELQIKFIKENIKEYKNYLKNELNNLK